MGRSRLQYRAKHKGILSSNSRDKIREAHKSAPTIETLHIKEQEVREPDVEESSDELMDICDNAILEVPALYIQSGEYESYMKELEAREKAIDTVQPVRFDSFLKV